MRWTALLLAVPVVALAFAGLQGDVTNHAPPGADGGPPTTVQQVIDDRPDLDGATRSARLLRLERQVRNEAREAARAEVADQGPGPALDPGDDPGLDPGPAPEFVPAMVTDDGFEVVGGSARAGAGERVTYTVEVQPSIDVDALAFAAAVEQALHDPRSWAADVQLVRVDDPADARIRVVLAAPVEVDRLCAEAGLDTAGRFSCWNGRIAALNAMRWTEGARDFDDLDTYRTYLVNHEFGHGLGEGHVGCPGSARLAPVMMQQTVSTDSCTANGWPYPERLAD